MTIFCTNVAKEIVTADMSFIKSSVGFAQQIVTLTISNMEMNENGQELLETDSLLTVKAFAEEKNGDTTAATTANAQYAIDADLIQAWQLPNNQSLRDTQTQFSMVNDERQNNFSAFTPGEQYCSSLCSIIESMKI